MPVRLLFGLLAPRIIRCSSHWRIGLVIYQIVCAPSRRCPGTLSLRAVQAKRRLVRYVFAAGESCLLGGLSCRGLFGALARILGVGAVRILELADDEACDYKSPQMPAVDGVSRCVTAEKHGERCVCVRSAALTICSSCGSQGARIPSLSPRIFIPKRYFQVRKRQFTDISLNFASIT